MKVYAVEGNSQRLDGGAMFGNAPKAMWQKWVQADEENRIDLATRAMLVEYDDGAVILFEAGVGAFFDPKMKERYAVVEDRHVLLDNLNALGYAEESINFVVLSHLHFDHAGGLLSAWQQDKPARLLFPNAQYLVSERQWQRALSPHVRDRASYIPEMIQLLEQSGRLSLVDGSEHPLVKGKMRFHYSEGHTPGLMLAEVDLENGPMVFASDLIPGMAWVHHAITMGYDRYPEKIIDEKIALLNDLVERGGSLFFTHDTNVARAKVIKNDKGRFVPIEHSL